MEDLKKLSMQEILTVENVSKRFRIRTSSPYTLKESVIQLLTGRRNPEHLLWALRDISFTVEKGRVLGIIGHNGAGKSTLLRLLSGLGRPSSGQIHVAGNIGSLLELGSGFHHELTGRENLMTGGILTGLTKREVKEIEEEIISFAELEEFIDQPVRTYSSGMYMRLAFATAIHFNPEILVIDEVLSVGDSSFQKKCIERLHKFRSAGKSLILVSHDLDQIIGLCDEVLVLEEGRIVMHSDPESAIHCYHDLMRQRTEKRTAQVSGHRQSNLVVKRGSRQGTMEASIEAVHLLDDHDRTLESLSSGGSITVELEYRLTPPVSDIAVILGVFSETGVKCFEVSVPSVKEAFGPLSDCGSLRCRLHAIPLLSGTYYVNVGLYPTNWAFIYDYHWQMHAFHILEGKNKSAYITGFLSISPIWSVMTRT